MRKIFLRCVSLECLINDIRRAFPEYAGEVEYSTPTGGVHLIGDIATEFDQEGNPTGFVGQQHANIFVDDDFDDSIFQTRMYEPPEKPINKLAL
ncbi:MAG: hypothetical protein PHU33_15995 [Bacteroidales bacterium]|nr:hypothetical protein [Bacteroidales bacterium]